MRLGLAVLCDYAAVREGLLHLMGGGVSILVRPDLPASMHVHLALLFRAESAGDLTSPHQLRVSVVAEDNDEQVAEAGASWNALVDLDPAADLLPDVPLALDMRPVGLPRHGFYSVRVELDGQQLESLRLLASKELPTGTAARP